MNKAEREALILSVKQAILTYCQMQPEDSKEASYYRAKMESINREFETIVRLLKKEPDIAIKAARAIVNHINDYKEYTIKNRTEKYKKN